MTEVIDHVFVSFYVPALLTDWLFHNNTNDKNQLIITEFWLDNNVQYLIISQSGRREVRVEL